MARSYRNKDVKNSEKPQETYIAVPQTYTFESPNIREDWFNGILLITLYTIQGFYIGLFIAFSTILQSTKMISYTQQAKFSIVSWPYVIKILWAPIVDALYIQKIGRRKSWLIPIQLLMGLFLMFLARNIEDWIPTPTNKEGNLNMLILIVFILNFLSATQDIVVDGWSLTMLKKKNVSYSSTCNTVGVPIGMFISSICFILLVSEDFKKMFVPTTPGTGGIISMKSFFYFWAAFVLCITMAVAILKKEKQSLEHNHEKISVFQNYKLLWKILKLPNMKLLAIALLTARIGFSTAEIVSPLKLIDAGISKDKIMMMNAFMYAGKFGLPIFVSRFTTGRKPMSYYLNVTPVRLFMGVIFSVFVYYTPSFKIINAQTSYMPWYYYLILANLTFINEMLSLFMQLAIISFFCRLSDPRYGGTYMTLFNTFFFIGWLIPNTFSLNLVDLLSFSRCHKDPRCSTVESACEFSSICAVYIDGYYVSITICTIIGFIWYFCFKNIIKHYQSLSLCNWMVISQGSNSEEINESCVTVK